jgi:hypothetical protein
MNDGEQKRSNAHALSGIRTPGLSVQAIKVYASECVATGTGLPRAEKLCCIELIGPMLFLSVVIVAAAKLSSSSRFHFDSPNFRTLVSELCLYYSFPNIKGICAVWITQEG